MKNFITLSILILSGLFSTAQNKEFYLSAGTGTNYCAWSLSSSFGIKSASTPIQAEIGYFVSKRVNVALSFNYSSAQTNTIDYDNNGSLFNAEAKASSFLVKSNVYYVSREKFKMGSGLGLGLLSGTAKVNFVSGNEVPVALGKFKGMALQINLLEARYKITKNIGVYGNFGFGHQGIWGLGLTANLDNK